MKCPYCGHENDDQKSCCGHCFAELPVKRKKQEKNDKKKSERS